MRPIRAFFRYRRDLKARARDLRHDPTPAERKLWFDFLSTHFEKFTRQKPLGRYVADFYCARHRLVMELVFTNADVLQQFEAVCARIDEVLANCSTK